MGLDMTDLYDGLCNYSIVYNEKNDCSVCAIALATTEGYCVAHRALEVQGRLAGKATPRRMSERAIEALGYKITKFYPSKVLPSGGYGRFTPRTITKWTDLDKRYVAFVRGHMFAIVNNQVEDWSGRGKGTCHRIQEVWEIN